MSNPHEDSSDRKLRHGGISGIVLGVLALLACELPIILAIVGLGGLSAGAVAFRPPAWVELVAAVIFIIGVGLLLYLFVKRRRTRRKAREI